MAFRILRELRIVESESVQNGDRITTIKINDGDDFMTQEKAVSFLDDALKSFGEKEYNYFLYFSSKSLEGKPGVGNIIYKTDSKIKDLDDIIKAQEYIRNQVTHTKGVALHLGSVTISNIVLL